MKRIMVFIFSALLTMVCSSCSKDGALVIDKQVPIRFDKESLNFDANENSASVKVLFDDGNDVNSLGVWGIKMVTIEVDGEKTEMMNLFETVVVNDKESYNVYQNELKGNGFVVKRNDGNLLIELKANAKPYARSLEIIVAGGSRGEGKLIVTQEGHK